ncbi:MAG: HEAT repeat domain-containing protein [Leptolyngbyaceae cyanobacterium]
MFVESDPIGLSSEVAAQLKKTIHRLIEGDFREKWEAVKRFAGIGPEAIAALTPLLEDEEQDWEVRWFAARAIGQFGHPEALKALVQFVQKTKEAELVAIAAEGLSQFGERGVNTLVQLLKQPAHQLTAVQALASIQHPSVYRPLLAVAQSVQNEPAIRATALIALSNFRHAQVDDLLLELARDPHVAVRREAIVHLGMRPHLLDQVDLINLLLPGLWDAHFKVSQATAIALGRLGTETAVTALAEAMTAPHVTESLQFTMIHSLGWIERESALMTLLNLLEQLSISLQTEIVETISRFQTPYLRQQAGKGLYDWLKNSDWAADDALSTPQQCQFRAAIALALGNLQYQPAASILQQLQATSDPQTRLYAEAALRQLAR